MKLRHLLVSLCACYISGAWADIYKHVDADGHVTYSSTKTKGAKKLKLPPLSTSLPPRRYSANPYTGSPSDFPRVDSGTQRNRDEGRRKILEDELAAEDKLLEIARNNLKEGEANPEVFRGQNGSIHRNVVKYEEKMKDLQEQVNLHSTNIEALKSELSKLPDSAR